MQVLTNVVNFFLGLGAPIFVPIIMIVGSILVGMKIRTRFHPASHLAWHLRA